MEIEFYTFNSQMNEKICLQKMPYFFHRGTVGLNKNFCDMIQFK
jgi:hypothetical protein